MTYAEWIEYVKKVVLQYDEGAIYANEAFNAIVNRAMEVEQKVEEVEQKVEEVE